MKSVKNIINANNNGGISISPKETMNNAGKNFIKTKYSWYAILNQWVKKINIYKVDSIKAPKTKR